MAAVTTMATMPAATAWDVTEAPVTAAATVCATVEGTAAAAATVVVVPDAADVATDWEASTAISFMTTLATWAGSRSGSVPYCSARGAGSSRHS